MIRRIAAALATTALCTQALAVPLATQVVARQLPPGWNHTNFPIAPSVQIFPNEAQITTLGGFATFTGRVDDATVNQFIMTTAAVGTFKVGQLLYGPGTRWLDDYTYILTQKTSSLPTGCSSTTLAAAASCYTLGTNGGDNFASLPMYSDGSQVVTGISDLRGNAVITATPSANYNPPVVKVDRCGRKLLSFGLSGGSTSSGTYMQGVASSLALDTYNMTWLMVGRFHGFKGGTIISIGSTGGSGSTAPSTSALAQLTVAADLNSGYDGQYVEGIRAFVANGGGSGTRATNAGQIVAGTNLMLIGGSVSTTDGLGATSTTATYQYFANDKAATWGGNPYLSANIGGRATGRTSFEIGRKANNNATTPDYFDLYELVGWLNDELAEGTTGAARTAKIVANATKMRDAMLANWKLGGFTDNVVFVTDSRGEVTVHGGTVPADYLTEPCAPYKLPDTTRVVNLAYGGGTVQTHWPWMAYAPDSIFATTQMFGGGHDKVLLLDGVNSVGTLWPDVTGSGSRTTAHGDEVYDHGGALDLTFQGYITAATNQINITTPGTYDVSLVVTPAGGSGSSWPLELSGPAPLPTSIRINSCSSSTLCTLSATVASAVGSIGTPVTFTTDYASHRRETQLLLNRGWKVVKVIEQYTAGGIIDAGQTQLRLRNLTNLATDTGNSPNLKIVDVAQIQVGGQFPMGVDASTGRFVKSCYTDSLHFLEACRRLWITGGETPQNGVRAYLLP